MHKYIWEKKYSVGIIEIDKQHQHFFAIANEIIEMAGKPEVPTSELLFKIIDLSNYALYHFLTEEGIFDRYNYPEAQAHINTHNDYRKKIKQFIAMVEKQKSNKKELATQMAEFVGDWLKEHILVMDRKYSGFMHKKGLS